MNDDEECNDGDHDHHEAAKVAPSFNGHIYGPRH